MTINKISDRSYLCFISSGEVYKRHIDLDTFCYRSSSCKKLTEEITTRLQREFSVSEQDLPFVLEYIPTSCEIYVQVTFSEEYDEIDPRFTQFAPQVMKYAADSSESFHDTDDFDVFSDTYEPVSNQVEKKTVFSEQNGLTQYILCFSDYNDLVAGVACFEQASFVRSMLYFDRQEKRYYLYVSTVQKKTLSESWTDFASVSPAPDASIAFMKEHYQCIFPAHAFERLKEAIVK